MTLSEIPPPIREYMEYIAECSGPEMVKRWLYARDEEYRRIPRYLRRDNQVVPWTDELGPRDLKTKLPRDCKKIPDELALTVLVRRLERRLVNRA
jgi:hypothetical protein